MKRALPWILLAACGDNRLGTASPADALTDGAIAHDPPSCQATFSENFVERWDGPADCGEMTIDADSGDAVLGLSIPSSYLGVSFEVAIDLGASPGAGTYSSQSSGNDWHVSALKEFDMTSCLYQAGAGRIPPGTYTLTLDAVGEVPHGTLDVALYVLSRPYTYCGERSTEHLRMTF